MSRRIHWIAGAVGVVAFCAGVLVLFTTDRDARSGFLLTLGVVLVLVAVLRERVQLDGFEILGAKLRVREVVKKRLELAAASAAPVHADDPEALHRQARVLQELVGLYQLYAHIRSVEPPSDERMETLDELASQMRQIGPEGEFDLAEVVGWFRDGTDPLRVIAINLMLADEDLRDFHTVLETIDAPHSGFEQYWGLQLAEAMQPGLTPFHSQLLRDAIERARRKRRFRHDIHRMNVADRIVAQIDRGPRAPRL